MTRTIFRGARELADYIGFTENAIHILVARGALPVHRHGRLLIFLKEEIDNYFARLPGVTIADALRALDGRAVSASRSPARLTQREARQAGDGCEP